MDASPSLNSYVTDGYTLHEFDLLVKMTQERQHRALFYIKGKKRKPGAVKEASVIGAAVLNIAKSYFKKPAPKPQAMPETLVFTKGEQMSVALIDDLQKKALSCLQICQAPQLEITPFTPPLSKAEIHAFNQSLPLSLEVIGNGSLKLSLLYPIDANDLKKLTKAFKRISLSMMPKGSMALALNASILDANATDLMKLLILYFSRLLTAFEYRDTFSVHDKSRQESLLYLLEGSGKVQTLDFSQAASVSGEQFISLVSALATPRELYFPPSLSLDAKILQRIACSCVSLYTISFAGCRHLPENAFYPFTTELPMLKTIDMKETLAGDGFLKTLSKPSSFTLNGLSHLNLEGSAISDEGLKALGETTQFVLSYINLSRCLKISWEGVYEMLKRHLLATVDLTECKNISTADVEKLKKAYPCVTFLPMELKEAAERPQIDPNTKLYFYLSWYLQTLFSDPSAIIFQEKEMILKINPLPGLLKEIQDRRRSFPKEMLSLFRKQSLFLEMGFEVFRLKADHPLADFLNLITPFIKRMELSEWPNHTSIIAYPKMRTFPELEELTIADCSIEDQELNLVHMPKIKAFSLIHCPKLTDRSLEDLLVKFPKLETLKLINCKSISLKAIAKIIKELPSRIRLEFIPSSRMSDIGSLNQIEILEFFKAFPNPRRKEMLALQLSLSDAVKMTPGNIADLYHLACSNGHRRLQDKCEHYLQELFRGAIVLSFSNHRLTLGLENYAILSQLKDGSSLPFALFLKGLAENREIECRLASANLDPNQTLLLPLFFLHIAKALASLTWESGPCGICSFKEFSPLLKSCARLTTLHLKGFSLINGALSDILDNLHSLNELYFFQCVGIQIAEPMKNASLKKPRLSILHLGFVNCKAMKPQDLEPFLSFSPSLQSLNLSQCPQFTDKTLLQVAEKAPGLSSLSVSGMELNCQTVSSPKFHFESLISFDAANTAMTDQTLKILAAKMPRLQTLVLDQNPLSSQGMLACLSDWPFLVDLSMKSCNFVSDAFLEKLSLLPNRFQRIAINSCPQVTIQGVKKLTADRSELKKIEVMGCSILPQLQLFLHTMGESPAEIDHDGQSPHQVTLDFSLELPQEAFAIFLGRQQAIRSITALHVLNPQTLLQTLSLISKKELVQELEIDNLTELSADLRKSLYALFPNLVVCRLQNESASQSDLDDENSTHESEEAGSSN